jgi:hypothetical protein
MEPKGRSLAKAGAHSSNARAAAKWIPAYAGTRNVITKIAAIVGYISRIE